MRLTQETVVGLFSESLLGGEEQESEGQEDLDVRVLLEDGVLHLPGVLQVGHADGVVALGVADGVQGVQDHALGQTKIVRGGSVDGVVGAPGVAQDTQLLDAVHAALAKTSNLNAATERYWSRNVLFLCKNLHFNAVFYQMELTQ